MFKICMWMNVKTHYQSAFFEAISADGRFDLQVRYFSQISAKTQEKGYAKEGILSPYEKNVSDCRTPQQMSETVLDWRKRIHIASYAISPQLVQYWTKENIRWCHWSERYGIRLVTLLHFHNLLWGLGRPLLWGMKSAEGRYLRNNALGVFAQGELAKRDFMHVGVPQEKIRYLFYSPAPLASADPPEEISKWRADAKLLFVYIGSLYRRKGIDCLLKAFAKLPPKTKLLLVGPDWEHGYYTALSDRLKLGDRVKFTGTVPNTNIAAYLSAADVVIHPARFDGWCVVLDEAASLGKALISTDETGAAWHLIRHGENGYRVKAGSVDALREAMWKYLDDPRLVRQHGEVSRKLYFSEFTPQRNVDRLWDALNSWMTL